MVQRFVSVVVVMNVAVVLAIAGLVALAAVTGRLSELLVRIPGPVYSVAGALATYALLAALAMLAMGMYAVAVAASAGAALVLVRLVRAARRHCIERRCRWPLRLARDAAGVALAAAVFVTMAGMVVLLSAAAFEVARR